MDFLSRIQLVPLQNAYCTNPIFIQIVILYGKPAIYRRMFFFNVNAVAMVANAFQCKLQIKRVFGHVSWLMTHAIDMKYSAYAQWIHLWADKDEKKSVFQSVVSGYFETLLTLHVWCASCCIIALNVSHIQNCLKLLFSPFRRKKQC